MRGRDGKRGSVREPANSHGEGEQLPDVVRRALRCLPATPSSDKEPEIDLRAAFRFACERAREEGLRAEQLLLVLKAIWHDLPESRQMSPVDADAVLARAVTACIRECYGEPLTSGNSAKEAYRFRGAVATDTSIIGSAVDGQ